MNQIVSDWLVNNVTQLTLLVTTVLMVITLFYTVITRKMLLLSSRPTLTVKADDINIHPKISNKAVIKDEDDDLGKERYWLHVNCCISNIGQHSAQNIFVDAEVHFVNRKPLGKKKLPIHRPEFVSFLPATGVKGDSLDKIDICFDNFVAREIVRDFFSARENFKGMAFLPSSKDLKKRSLWPSPKIVVKCFYSDIQGQEYLSELIIYFHMWRDDENEKLDMYQLNMQEIEFGGIRKISKMQRNRHIKTTRHLRYSSFSGEKYSKNDLLLLVANRAEDEKEKNKRQ